MSGAGPRQGRAGINFTGPLAGLGNRILQRFGVKSAERNPQREAFVAKSGSSAHLHAHVMPLTMQLWIGARLPFGAFVLILAMFTYMYHIAPIVPWLLSFFSITFAVVVCWPPKHVGQKPRGMWDWGPMCSWFIAVSFGVGLGLLNYGVLESWINTTFLREYKGLRANTDPRSVADAGILTFADNVRLDTTMSAGYKFWFYNYCAAPVVAEDPTSVPIHFWAVGVGCCKGRAVFTCDSAGDATAKSGVPLRKYNIAPETADHYMHAIRMAAASNDLQVAKDVVFVTWHKDPRTVGGDVWWFCTVIFISLIFVGLCACCGCQSGLTHMNVMQQHS